ncbi:MAG: hypothetical protein U1F77_04865 [Kiritimatiellia bacterium]
MKPTAENYERAMAEYEKTREAKIDLARQNYLTVLGSMRTSLQRAKQQAQVDVLDAEIKAVKAGPLAAEVPAGLPVQLVTYRRQYLAAPEKAEREIAPLRRHTREEYLRWLDGMEAGARVGKDDALAAGVEAERKRVRADAD